MTRTSSAPRRRSTVWVVAAFLGGILVLFIGISFAQELRRRLVLQRHVERLQQEIHGREQRIADLRQLIEYLGTDAYRERAAREKLNFQRPNERVIVIPESGAVLGTNRDVENAEPEVRQSIPRQWWELLFPPIAQ